jgi:hypothetical protein
LAQDDVVVTPGKVAKGRREVGEWTEEIFDSKVSEVSRER